MLTVETAGVRVAADLEEAERLSNECMRAFARLQMSMMNIRLETDLPQYQGHTAVMRVQEAQRAQVEAMGQLARAHKAMRDEFLTVTGMPDRLGRCPVSGKLEVAAEAA